MSAVTPERDVVLAMQPVSAYRRVFTTRRVAATARAALSALGLAIVAGNPALHPHPVVAAVGFAIVFACAVSQFAPPGTPHLKVEETLGATGGVLINGFGGEHVTVLTLLWLAALITGTLARARVDRVAGFIFIVALVMPIVLTGGVQINYVGLCLAAIALLASGRAFTAEQDALLEIARYEADHDDLTGALSRPAFRALLDETVASATPTQPVSLLLLDLNRFGLVNKLYGHAAGDALLTGTVERILALGPPGMIVGRLGGDEFAIAMHGDPAPFGIAHAPQDGSDGSSLLRAGDIALRMAKTSAARPICEYAGDSLAGDGEESAEASVFRLISGEGIEMAVQPMVDLATGETRAYEALARFGDGRSPLHWLSVAEEFGQRDALECACLAAATELLRELPDGAYLSVNLSGAVLPDSRTMAILQGVGDLSRLIIEITEDSLVRNDDPSLNAALAVLRRRGARLAVDDMGAGYAGLRQITAVHPDYLKLDRSLICGIHTDPDRAALVSAMVAYAESVGARVVAEGVECDEELAQCAALGVHLVQGFQLGRPGAPWPSIAAHPAIAERDAA
jgi:predicted signal transduction protein with EAL and GGDEF domain